MDGEQRHDGRASIERVMAARLARVHGWHALPGNGTPRPMALHSSAARRNTFMGIDNVCNLKFGWFGLIFEC